MLLTVKFRVVLDDDSGVGDKPPGKPCGESWIRAEFTCHEGETERAKATGILYTIQKASRLKSQAARVRRIKELKDRIKDEKFLKQLIKELGLGYKSADPKTVADRIATLHSLLNEDDDIDTTIQKIKKLPYLKQLVQDIPEYDDKIDLSIASEIDPANITGKVEQALNTLQDYKNISNSIASLSKRIAEGSSPKTQQEYDELFNEMEDLFKQLKNNVTRTKSLGEVKTGNAQADLEINEYLAFVGSISRETLPGYRVTLPKDLQRIKDKAASDPC